VNRSDALTIRLTGKTDDVPVASFLRVVEETVKALRAVANRDERQPPPRMRWDVIGASKQSPLSLTVAPRSAADHSAAARRLIQGVRGVEQGDVLPPGFSLQALRSLRCAVGVLDDGVESIEFEAGGEKVTATDQFRMNATRIVLRTLRVHRVRTTMRGILDTLTVKGDVPVFFIRDRLRGRNVACRFSRDQLDEVKAALGSRVAVWGQARFSKEDDPTSIKVEDFRILPSMDQTIRLDQMTSVDITNGVDPAEYIRRLRDGE